LVRAASESPALHFNGNYASANFDSTSDGSGGTIVYDPPPSLTPDAIHIGVQIPGTLTNTVVASAPNATLSGNGINAFVFNFTDVATRQ
jgi:hypothetical protein